MNKSTAKALEQSIKHWERMRDASPNNPVEYPNAYSCPLCAIYIRNYKCGKCPVKERTGHAGCNKTPYEKANYYFWEIRNGRRKSTKLWQRHAQKMIDFLISLRNQP